MLLFSAAVTLSKLPHNPDSIKDVFYLKVPSSIPPDHGLPDSHLESTQSAAWSATFCKAANLPQWTNHALCVTGATRLFDGGIPEKVVKEFTGHQSIECLRKYERTSEQYKKAASYCMTSGQFFDPILPLQRDHQSNKTQRLIA